MENLNHNQREKNHILEKNLTETLTKLFNYKNELKKKKKNILDYLYDEKIILDYFKLSFLVEFMRFDLEITEEMFMGIKNELLLIFLLKNYPQKVYFKWNLLQKIFFRDEVLVKNIEYIGICKSYSSCIEVFTFFDSSFNFSKETKILNKIKKKIFEEELGKIYSILDKDMSILTYQALSIYYNHLDLIKNKLINN